MSYFRKKQASLLNAGVGALLGAGAGALGGKILTKNENNEQRNMARGVIGGAVLGAGVGAFFKPMQASLKVEVNKAPVVESTSVVKGKTEKELDDEFEKRFMEARGLTEIYRKAMSKSRFQIAQEYIAKNVDNGTTSVSTPKTKAYSSTKPKSKKNQQEIQNAISKSAETTVRNKHTKTKMTKKQRNEYNRSKKGSVWGSTGYLAKKGYEKFRGEKKMTYFRQKSANVLPGIIGGLAGGVSSAIAANHMTKDPNNTRRNMVLSGIGGTLVGAGLGLVSPQLMKKTKAKGVEAKTLNIIKSTEQPTQDLKKFTDKGVGEVFNLAEAMAHINKTDKELQIKNNIRKFKAYNDTRLATYKSTPIMKNKKVKGIPLSMISPERFKQSTRRGYVKYDKKSLLNEKSQLAISREKEIRNNRWDKKRKKKSASLLRDGAILGAGVIAGGGLVHAYNKKEKMMKDADPSLKWTDGYMTGRMMNPTQVPRIPYPRNNFYMPSNRGGGNDGNAGSTGQLVLAGGRR